MPNLSFMLNGKEVRAKAGSTILESARLNGVTVPTLCHDPRLKPTAACRICLVEVEGAKGPMPACTSLIAEGMVVRTHTDDLADIRRMALELLLSDHYGDCTAPCKLACPAGVDVQGYIALIAAGEYKEALKLIKETLPLPLSIGRVCPRFCEQKCRRNLLEGPVAIDALKRFVADRDLNGGLPYTPRPKPPTGSRVAVVGGGPAGLTAAYYLALEGHGVDILDASSALGGMLRYGIPEYRLPKKILDKEIASITRLCNKVKLNARLGRDFTIEGLKAQGYKAIFIGLGAQADQQMRVEGEDSPGVLSGIGFLREVALGKKVSLGKRVVVIGGGNTAIDVSRTALRLGADEVTIAYRRSREEMPANAEEIEQAEEEGVKIDFLTAPTCVTCCEGGIEGLTCTRMELGEPDASGRRRPVPIEGSEFAMTADTVIAAIGQTMDSSGLDDGIALTKRGYLEVNKDTMETGVEGIFSGGDCVSGPATVVEAIAAGRRAARSIDQYIRGLPITPEPKPYNCVKGDIEDINPEDYKDEKRISRAEMPMLKPTERKRSFQEIEMGLSEETALKETERCLACGCQDIYECELRRLATEYGADDSRYAGRKHRLGINEDEHPFITKDQNKCVLCGRCVRICTEVMGISAWGFVNRGFETVVEPSLGMELAETDCTSCSQCVSTCPTGALTPKTPLPKAGPWDIKTVSTICPHCGVGCNLDIGAVGGRVATVASPEGSTTNNGNLCHKGAYTHILTDEAEHLAEPLVKRDNGLIPTDWDAALAAAGEGLQKTVSKHGKDAISILVSPHLTNEECYLAMKLAEGLKTADITALGASTSGAALRKLLGEDASTCSYASLSASDLILSFNCDPDEDYPVAGIKLREALGRGGNLIVMTPNPTRLDRKAAEAIRVKASAGESALKTMLDCINGQTIKPRDIAPAAELYAKAKRPVIVTNADSASAAELELLGEIMLATGNIGRNDAGLLLLRGQGNAQGLMDMGGGAIGKTNGERPKGVIVLGGTAEDMPKGAGFSVLLTHALPEKPPYPDVVLPAAAPAESEGTYTSAERRVQRLKKVMPPSGGKANWKIIAALSGAVGSPLEYKSISAVTKEIAEKMPGFKVGRIMPFKGRG